MTNHICAWCNDKFKQDVTKIGRNNWEYDFDNYDNVYEKHGKNASVSNSVCRECADDIMNNDLSISLNGYDVKDLAETLELSEGDVVDYIEDESIEAYIQEYQDSFE